MSSIFLLFLTLSSVLCYTNGSNVKVTITPNTVPVFFIDGRRLSLTCTVRTKEDVKISWTKMEDPLDPEEYQIDSWDGGDEHGPTKNVRMTKNKAGQSDVADFRCSIGNADQMAQTSSFFVFIRDANVTEGSVTTLTCKPELFYANKTVTWLKGTVPITEIPDLKGRIEIGNDTVSIRDTKISDSGVYTCRIQIGPSAELNQIFDENVTLQGKPYIMNLNNPEMNKQITNTSIVLKCPAGGQPVPEVFWFRDGDVIEQSNRISMTALNGQQSGQLEIINTTKSDFGQYSCSAENYMGKASLKFELVDPSLGNSGMKHNFFLLQPSSVLLYISVVAITSSWTR